MMKLYIEKVKQIPKDFSDKFGVCVYGEPTEELKDWISQHKFATEKVGPYTNVIMDKSPKESFAYNKAQYEYMDGFSPNLNKHLHIGHASNLVLAKAFVSMGVAKNTVSILGDTLQGGVPKEEALSKFYSLCDKFQYPLNKVLFASEMKIDEFYLVPGEGEYEGTKVFLIDEEKVVGIKSDGSTTYFYQDVSLAKLLNSPTLYLTGMEQNQHFDNLKKLFPHKISHLGLGLVTMKDPGGKLTKMSSRNRNVIMFEDVMDMLNESFGNDKTSYNVLAGFILKSIPKSGKILNMATLSNPLNSPGLYLSYTLAKLKSAGVDVEDKTEFESFNLQFKEMKAVELLQPNILFDGLTDHAKKISILYETHKIVGNEDNKKMFSGLASDLVLGLKKMGLFEIEKV